MLLVIKKFPTGPVTGPRSTSLVSRLGKGPNTADQGPVVGPVRSFLINGIMLLIKDFRIGPVTGPRSSVLARADNFTN